MTKILIISDLHVYNDVPDGVSKWTQPSRAKVGGTSTEEGAHEFLLKYIEKNLSSFDVDAIICLGDVCDRSDPKGFQEGYNVVKRIRELVRKDSKSVPLAFAIGNHDLDSRKTRTDYDPKEHILLKYRNFPFDKRDVANEFWARGYAFDLLLPNVRILNVNSSAYHYGEDQELNHGRISNLTLDDIKSHLASNKFDGINICITHHHLTKQYHAGQDDNESMVRGELLLKLLDEDDCEWLILHGHQHVTHVQYSGQSSRAPFVFSVGSAFAKPWPPTESISANQVYVMEIENSSNIKGVIKSHQYNLPGLWQPGSTLTALPSRCGFGFREVESLAREIAARDFESTSIAEIYGEFPRIHNLIPQDIQKLLIELQNLNFQGAIESGVIVEIFKK